MNDDALAAAGPPGQNLRGTARLEWLWTLAALAVHAAALAPVALLAWPIATYLGPLSVLLLPLAHGLFLASLLLVLGLVRQLLPPPPCGLHPAHGRAVTLWALHYGTLNMVRLPGHEHLLLANPLLRRLYYRVFGARVHPSARISYEATLTDPWLLEVGAGAKIGAFALVGGHVADHRGFLLARTTIGADALVGAGSLIGAGARIGEGALVAPRAALLPGTVVPAGELWSGCPARGRGKLDELPLQL